MLNSTLLYAATACITSSQDMIRICRRQAYGLPDSQMLTPWWMNILCESTVSLGNICLLILSSRPDIYTAAVAMAAALMTHSLQGRIDTSSVNQSMEEAITVLQYYAQTRSAAGRCLVTLTAILQSQFPQRNQAENTGKASETAFPGPAQSQQAQDLIVENGTQAMNGMGWAMTADDIQNAAVFGYFSDAWLTQPPMDNFDLLGT